MRALPVDLRRQLESAVVAGRRAAEAGVRAALSSLGVEESAKPSHLSDEQARLRRGLRAKQRQLGGGFDVLVWDAAYEQWHRLLFARFLTENDLLRHPQFGVPVTLDDCAELAEELGEPDGWSVAARFAAEILPGIFRLDDPCVQLRLAPEHRVALERILGDLPSEVFTADDSLGWVYQYWQSERKNEVNASEVKIGGADLGPVTQLFTENYMVRFLLENSLGAWWAARHSDSPLIKEFEYLRYDDGQPADGRFDGWPDTAAEVTVMDPCCGSGHFLVEAFGMLWRMRAEEEGLDTVAAQDGVLRDNLFGLELDPRCVQIAMFAVAVTAWKESGGWRELPTPHVACSGIPVKASREEWRALAEGDERLEQALERLHVLFKEADSLGSLIDPRRAAEMAEAAGQQKTMWDAAFDEIAPLLEKAVARETEDPATSVLGANAAGIARAATLLSRKYTLLATNVPYLGLQSAAPILVAFSEANYPDAAYDLATIFLERCKEMSQAGVATVTQLNWAFLARFSAFRRKWLRETSTHAFCILGPGAFSAISGEVVQALLSIGSSIGAGSHVFALDLRSARGPEAKAAALKSSRPIVMTQESFRSSPDTLLSLATSDLSPLSEFADSWQGLVTGDRARFILKFWEVVTSGGVWAQIVTAPSHTADFCGRESVLRWEHGSGALVKESTAHNFNPAEVVGKAGVLVSEGNLSATRYMGEFFNQASVPLIPHNPADLPAMWCFISSPSFVEHVRLINNKIIVGAGYILKVPFDVDHWRAVAAERFPSGLPRPWSDDPTQWLFGGRPEVATEPLQVGVGQLVGYRWPEQPAADDLDELADEDGIVCLPAVGGEVPAADRLTVLLARAHGDAWSPGLMRSLLEQTGSGKKSLADWLREDFFKHHCKVFAHRPFVWHIWDGRKDGFSALVNYHRLDRAGLEKLTYTYLGDWIERQRAAAAEDITGADVRLAAAQELRGKLELILEGEPPYDIYVRWKPLHEQPIGWDPDLDDGVRLNIRPFIEAGVLRSKVNVHWKNDRGKNPDGSERHNDLHFTNAEKQQARQEAADA